MTEFKVGDRVEVSNEEKARATSADVHKGDIGTIADRGNELYAHVIMDNHPIGREDSPWSIPKDGLRIIKEG